MSVAFLITSPYQVYHYKWIAAHLQDVTAVIEIREREYGLSEEFVRQHLPMCDVRHVSKERLTSLDGRFDVIVCQTPILPLAFLQRSLVVAQQYSLAKERYQYGVWRAHAHLNLMYGPYSVEKVQGFSNAVAVGNPLLDPYFLESPRQTGPVGWRDRRPRLLYMPTYGELSSLPQVLPRLRDIAADITLKIHHSEDVDSVGGPPDHIRVVRSEADPVELFRTHDGVISDFSGAAYDALYAGLPVVVADPVRRQHGADFERLSSDEREFTLLTDLVAIWRGEGDLLDALAAAEERLGSPVHKSFLERTFVNAGAAGKSCAQAIESLRTNGEPPHFGAEQVRATTKRYILTNRELRARAGRDSRQRGGGPAAAATGGPSELRLAYRRMRRFLARSQAMRRLVHGGRWWVRRWLTRGETEPAGPVPAPSPRQRREAILQLLAPHLASEGVLAARDSEVDGAEVAVLTSAKAGLDRALRRLAAEHPYLAVRVGMEWRAVETVPLSQLKPRHLANAQWLALGNPRESGTYRIGTAGYLRLQFVEHDQARNRYLALNQRADRVDWTSLFTSDSETAQRPSPVRVGTRKAHAAAPIDVVYTWVDSGDPKWRADHQRYSAGHEVHNVSANNEERYIDREELRYSMRSLWTFAPFVRNIYLVTADQRPSWLNPEDGRVTLVSHRDIFPDAGVLPTFNSHAIEACLHRIPGLSEHFLYMNDDVFLGREVDESDFFTSAGLAKVRFSPSQYIYQGRPEAVAIPTDWAAYNSVSLTKRDFDLTFDRRVQHVPLPLRRSVMEEIEQRYPEEVAQTRAARFRAVTDLAIPSMFGQFYAIATARAVEWPGRRDEYLYLDTGRYDSLSRFGEILSRRPRFFCLNVTRHAEVELAAQAGHLRDFLAPAFPSPAPWELPPG